MPKSVVDAARPVERMNKNLCLHGWHKALLLQVALGHQAELFREGSVLLLLWLIEPRVERESELNPRLALSLSLSLFSWDGNGDGSNTLLEIATTQHRHRMIDGPMMFLFLGSHLRSLPDGIDIDICSNAIR